MMSSGTAQGRMHGAGRMDGEKRPPVTPASDDPGFASRVLRRREAEELRSVPVAVLAEHRHRERIVRMEPRHGKRSVLTSPAVVAVLEQFLTAGRTIGPGAAVTLLAPVVGAVRSAAAEGIWLAPTADDIGLTEQGRPVLLLTTPAVDTPREARESLQRVLERVGPHCPKLPVAALARHRDLLALEGTLYGLADPQGIGEEVRALRASAGAGIRPSAASVPLGRHRRVHPLDGWPDRARALAVRRRGPLATALVILLGAVLTGMLAGSPDELRAAGAADSVSTSSGTPYPTVNPSLPPTPAAQAVPAALEAEEAAELLLAAARACEDHSCTRRLVTADSPLGTVGDGVADRLPAHGDVSAVLADVNGASAVVHLGTPPGTAAASVLIIRTEAGWLIRDVYAGATP
ncbi:hypothetical protein C5D07_10840 [Rathayibacter tritici]|uniref:hypothetical protein n=1 Tax=Rathayibacter tritici TaxID=33888 RepID=UPI000D4FC5CE|nr:hypothetical protein [Rathayibacter tritici]PPI13010.1 hypothetical protein C5D07_10840 [Rathayibacter tritici]